MSELFFLTSDEVNAALARRRAVWLHITLVVLGPADSIPDTGVLVVDWDNVTDELKQRILALPPRGSFVVIIHTYNHDLLKLTLDGHPIFVCRTLDQVFEELQALRRAA